MHTLRRLNVAMQQYVIIAQTSGVMMIGLVIVVQNLDNVQDGRHQQIPMMY